MARITSDLDLRDARELVYKRRHELEPSRPTMMDYATLEARAPGLRDACTPADAQLLYDGGWRADEARGRDALERVGPAVFVWSLRTHHFIPLPSPYDTHLLEFVVRSFPKDRDVALALAGALADPGTGSLRYAHERIHTVLMGEHGALDASILEASLVWLAADEIPALGYLELLDAHLPAHDLPLWERALDQGKPATRALALTHLTTKAPEHARARAHERLLSRTKKTRLSGCRILAALPHDDADLGRLEAALSKERTEDVSSALAELVSRADAHEEASDDDRIEWARGALSRQRRAKVPSFMSSVDLGPMRWTSGEALDERERLALVSLLRKEDDTNEVPSLRRIRAALDDDDCARWSERIERAWARAAYPARQKWAAYQIGILGDDARADAVALELPRFASQNYWKRAGWYLDAFARLGSDRALSWLLDLFCHQFDGSSIHDRARDLLREVAARRQTTTEELAARLDPYVRQVWREQDLDAPPLTPGVDTLSTDARTFTVLMDAELRLVLTDDEGARFDTKIPLVRGESKAARDEVLASLKERRAQVDAFVEVWRAHLEEAMVSARPFPMPHLRARFLSEPVMARLIETLVWRTEDGRSLRFSDGEAIDADYEPVSLSDDDSVLIAHPLELEANERSAWITHLVDAELGQVFEQLSRATFTRETDPLEGAYGTSGILARRFQDAFLACGLSYGGVATFTSRGTRIRFSMSGTYNYIDDLQEVGVSNIDFLDLWYEPRELARLDPVVYSEAILTTQRVLEVGALHIARARR